MITYDSAKPTYPNITVQWVAEPHAAFAPLFPPLSPSVASPSQNGETQTLARVSPASSPIPEIDLGFLRSLPLLIQVPSPNPWILPPVDLAADMSKRKFGVEGFGINRPVTYKFERTPAPQCLYVPPSSRGGGHDNHEDADLDNIEYDQLDAPDRSPPGGDDVEVDPLDAFMEGIQAEIRAPPPTSAKAKDKGDKYEDEDEDDPVESFLRMKKDVGLTLASEALHAGYDSDEEVYAAAKAVDLGMIEYDSDDNPIFVDKRKIEPIPALDHSTIEYEPFNKDFYEEKPSISGKVCSFSVVFYD